MYTKIIRFDALGLWRDYNRLIGKRVVATNGCFDVLQRGHVTYLRKARELGDTLIVGINSDLSMRELNRETDPVNCQEDRAAVIAALESVDQVVIYDDKTAESFLAIVQPNVWVKGGDYTKEMLDAQEVKTVEFWKGDVVIVAAVAGHGIARTSPVQAEASAPPILESCVSQRDESPATCGGGGKLEDAGEDAGSVLRSRSSLRAERGLSKG